MNSCVSLIGKVSLSLSLLTFFASTYGTETRRAERPHTYFNSYLQVRKASER